MYFIHSEMKLETKFRIYSEYSNNSRKDFLKIIDSYLASFDLEKLLSLLNRVLEIEFKNNNK